MARSRLLGRVSGLAALVVGLLVGLPSVAVADDPPAVVVTSSPAPVVGPGDVCWSGTSSGDTVLTLTVDSSAPWPRQISGGAWSICASVRGDGSHRWTLSQGSTIVQTASFVIDTVPPVNTTQALAPSQVHDGDPALVLSITGTDPGGSGLAGAQYRVDGGPAQDQQNGLVTLDVGSLGTHILETRVVDRAGNASAWRSESWTVESTIAITTPPGAQVGSSATWAGTGRAGQVVTVDVDGTTSTATVSTDGTWTATVAALSDGPHAWTVLDRQTQIGSGSFTAHTAVPSVTVTPSTDVTRTVAGDPDVTFDIEAPDAVSMTYTVDGATRTVAGPSANVTVPLGSAGTSHTLTVTAVNEYGNESAPVTTTWTVQRRAVVTSAPVGTVGVSASWAGTGRPGSALAVEVDGSASSVQVGSDGTWTFHVPGVTAGRHSWTVTDDTVQVGGGQFTSSDATPDVTVTPSTDLDGVHVGDPSVTLTIHGDSTLTRVTYTLDGTGHDGGPATVVTVPGGPAGTTHTVTVTGYNDLGNAARPVTTTWTVHEAAAPPAPDGPAPDAPTLSAPTLSAPTLSAPTLSAPSQTTSGASFVVEGDGFTPGETVTVELHSRAVALGTVVADGDGHIAMTVTIPTDVPVGVHHLVATERESGRSASWQITVNLSSTGAAIGPTAVAAAWLVAVGAALVVVARRRRRSAA